MTDHLRTAAEIRAELERIRAEFATFSEDKQRLERNIFETRIAALEWALSAPAAGREDVRTVREFANELGNQIKITIEGPRSISENTLTSKEAQELASALKDGLGPVIFAGAAKGSATLEPLSDTESKDLLSDAERLWESLQSNDLGGYSGINRPFYIVWKFREVLERYGRRNTGLNHTKAEIDSAPAPEAMSDAALVEAMVEAAYDSRYHKGSFQEEKRIRAAMNVSWPSASFHDLFADMNAASAVIHQHIGQEARNKALDEAAEMFRGRYVFGLTGDMIVVDILALKDKPNG